MASSVLIWSPMISRGQPQILTDTLAKKHRPPPGALAPHRRQRKDCKIYLQTSGYRVENRMQVPSLPR